MTPGTKVIFRANSCAFCEWAEKTYPHAVHPDTGLVEGRAYTVSVFFPAVHDQPAPVQGYGVVTMEVPLPPNWGHCSCNFHPIQGDEEAWHRIVAENRPKTKELEPA